MIGQSLDVLLAALLVFMNGFFVAAEFALVKLRPLRLATLVSEQRPFAETAQWLHRRLDASLSACQLGITVASLALGWIGEPALARILAEPLRQVGVQSAQLLHGIAFSLAFTGITAVHLVVGEQAPKMFAIRNPERLALFCALPLRVFCVLSYPLMVTLNSASGALLRMFRVQGTGPHERHYTEHEIRLLVEQARSEGELSRSEHQLITAVFELDDRVCRRIMVPRGDVVSFDVHMPVEECLERARRTKHTRYPLCDGSLDRVLGVVHLKDLLSLRPGQTVGEAGIARPPHYVPETLPISRLLRQFQAIRQHLVFVVDEYGTVIGIVTLENVLEQIVGPVEDEFDLETPMIVPDGAGKFLIAGSAPVDLVQSRLGLTLGAGEADTVSGALVAHSGRILQAGDRVELPGATVEVLEVRGARAEKVRVHLRSSADGGNR